MANLGKAVKGKSKKAAAKKGSKVSAGDAALEAKMRALDEANLQRQAAQTAQRILKERLELEKKFTRWNKAKIQNNWRKIMRLAKVEELRKDVEVISQNHERDVDRKDAIIQMHDKDVEDAEEHIQIAVRSHLQNIDKLIDLQDSRLLGLEHAFEKEKDVIQKQFEEERREIEEQHAVAKAELEAIIAAVEAQEAHECAGERAEFDHNKEMIRNRNLEAVHVLQSYLDNTIEELERNFESAHLNYLTNTDQRTQDFKNLTQRDQTLSQEIEIKLRKIDRLQSSLSLWRTKMASNARECEERNKTLRKERETVSMHYQELKRKMNSKRTASSRRLTALAQDARACEKDLAQKLNLAESLISHAEQARAMEVDREKIMPFYESVLDSQADKEEIIAEAKRQAAEMRPPASTAEAMGVFLQQDPDALDGTKPIALDDAGEPVPYWDALEKFNKKLNKALLDKLSMDREIEKLEAENEELQEVLKQYLSGISVHADAVDDANPLLVVNGRVNLARPPVRVAPGSQPAVEASHMVNTGRVGTRAGHW